MNHYIPDMITNDIKRGFSAPDASWFKGESIEYVNQIIFDKRSAIYDYFDVRAIQELVTGHIEGKTNRRLLIWSLLNFKWWLQKFMP